MFFGAINCTGHSLLFIHDVRLAHRLSAQLHLPVEASSARRGPGSGPALGPFATARKGLKALALQEGTGEEQCACLDATFSARPSNGPDREIVKTAVPL